MKYQVTFFNEENKYKPVACIIEAPGRTEIYRTLWKEAAKKVCAKRGWTFQEMTKTYGYKTWKCKLADNQ